MKEMTELPLFTDVEASGLHPDSYPVQVAWSDEQGSVEFHFIRPVEHWIHWDYNAQEMHGMSREFLFAHGEDVKTVANRMNEALGGKTIHTDNVMFDGGWIDMIFEEAGIDRTFEIADIFKIYHTPALLSARKKAWQPAWDITQGRAHQADVDVMHHVNVFVLVSRAVGSRKAIQNNDVSFP